MASVETSEINSVFIVAEELHHKKDGKNSISFGTAEEQAPDSGQPQPQEMFVLEDQDDLEKIREKAVKNLEHLPRKPSIILPGTVHNPARRDSFVRFDTNPLVILRENLDTGEPTAGNNTHSSSSEDEEEEEEEEEDSDGDILEMKITSRVSGHKDSIKIKRRDSTDKSAEASSETPDSAVDKLRFKWTDSLKIKRNKKETNVEKKTKQKKSLENGDQGETKIKR